MKASRKKREGVNVDLTPMIDVVFQLILFFLVSTTFAVLPAISVKLPESSTAQSASVQAITITIQEDGTLWFNDSQVSSVGEIGKFLSEFDTEGKKREEYPVTVEADSEVKNGMIVELFDELRKQDFVSVNLRTRSK